MMLKRFFATLSLGAILSTLVIAAPQAGAQSSTDATVNRVSPNIVNFDPTRGETAQIQYRVTNGTARDLTVDLYFAAAPRAEDPGQCNRSNRFFVGTIDGPADRAPGTFTASWNGLLRDGTPEIQGTYCYHIQWGNAPIGALGFVDGLIELRRDPVVVNPGGTGGTTGGGTTGSNTAGNGGSGGGVVTTAATGGLCANPFGFIDAQADTTTVDLRTNSLVNITYKACTAVPAGNSFSFGIYDDRGVPVFLSFSHNRGVPQGFIGTLSWNGQNNNRTNVQADKTYFYKFKVNGRDDAVGSIQVIWSGTTPPQQPLTIQYTISRSTIQVDPQTDTSLNSSTISFSANRTVQPQNSFRVVLDQGPSITTPLQLFGTNSSFITGSATWNGLIGGRAAAEGSYRFSFILDGTIITTGFLTVQHVTTQPPAQPPVITDRGPDPASFPIAVGTQFRFHLNQAATVQLHIFEPVFSGSRLVRTITANRSAGENSIAFDGRDQNGGLLGAGTYSYELRASNANGQATPRTGTFQITSDGGSQAPFITDRGPDKSIFDPTVGEIVTFAFDVNRAARVDFSIFDSSGRFVRNLLTSSQSNNTSAGRNTVVWNGRDSSGNIVNQGTYDYVISAIGGNTVRGTVRVDDRGAGGAFEISNLRAFPNPFDPQETSETEIRFDINDRARITVRVIDPRTGDTIRTLVSDRLYTDRNITVLWDGENRFGNRVQDGQYNVIVDGRSERDGSFDSKALIIVIDTQDGGRFRIKDHSVHPSTINPRKGDVATITFTTTQRPSDVRVEIVTESSRALVANLPVEELSSNVFRARWSGRDFSDNKFVRGDRTYRYIITARRSNERDTANGTIFVQDRDDKKPIGDCGNFKDVPRTHPLCEAIEFVVKRGIFKGHSDGTLRLNNVIQRAELLAVMIKGFRFPVAVYDERRDGDLGFPDLRNKTREWYMPFLKTGLRHHLMVGYPDGLMRPERTMNTAELYLVFLESALKSPHAIAKFTIDPTVRRAPFRDTPLTRETRWYIRYAQFARENGLVRSDFFHPAEGITRGQVIKLIFDAHQKGLIIFPDEGYYDDWNAEDYYIYYEDNTSYDNYYYDDYYSSDYYYDDYSRSDASYDRSYEAQYESRDRERDCDCERDDNRQQDTSNRPRPAYNEQLYSRDGFGNFVKDRKGNYFLRNGRFYEL